MHKSNVKHKIGCNNPTFAQNWIDSAPNGKIHQQKFVILKGEIQNLKGGFWKRFLDPGMPAQIKVPFKIYIVNLLTQYILNITQFSIVYKNLIWKTETTLYAYSCSSSLPSWKGKSVVVVAGGRRRGIINPSGKWRESSCYCSKKPSIFAQKN